MLGAREFAEQIGVPYPTVALWLKQNRIKEAEAVEVGKLKVYQVPADAVKLYKGEKARPKKGRPSKKAEGEGEAAEAAANGVIKTATTKAKKASTDAVATKPVKKGAAKKGKAD